jgi:hypothetical protein
VGKGEWGCYISSTYESVIGLDPCYQAVCILRVLGPAVYIHQSAYIQSYQLIARQFRIVYDIVNCSA